MSNNVPETNSKFSAIKTVLVLVLGVLIGWAVLSVVFSAIVVIVKFLLSLLLIGALVAIVFFVFRKDTH